MSGPRSSVVTRAAAVALLAAAVTFVLVSLRDPGYIHLYLVGDRVNPAVHRELATFVVEGAPFSLVELSVNGRHAGSAYVAWNGRTVRFEGTPLDDGRNVVVARTTLWYAASRRAHATALRVDNPPAAIAEHGTMRRHAGQVVPQSRNGRSLALRIRQQEVDAAFAVQLPQTDPAIVALRANRTSLPEFVDAVFGSPRFNRKPIASFFTGVASQMYVADQTVTVSADSGYQRLGLEDLPAFAGEVEIANAFIGPRIWPARGGDLGPALSARRWGYDMLRLRVDDYRVADPRPGPRETEGTSLVWARPFGDVRTPVAVSLTLAPFSSVEALRRALNLPIFAFAPHVAARFLAFAHGFVLAIPMLAYLALSRGRNARFATIARRLIVVAIAADVFDACISAQPDVDGEIVMIVPAMRALPPALSNQLVVPAVIGLVLAVLAWSIAHLAARARSVAAALVADAANAVCIATVGFIAVVAVGYAAGSTARDPFIYPVLVGAAFAAGLIAVLVAIGWWTIPGRGAPRQLFTVATVAFVLAIAVPISLAQFGVWVTAPEHAGTALADPLAPLPLAAAFLRSLAPLCPLAFGLLLFAGVRDDVAAIGLDRAAFMRLVFCCFAVLAGVVVIVPVGFALAWWTFDMVRKPVRDTAAAAGASDRDAVGTTPRARGYHAVPLALAFVLVEILLLLPSEMRFLRQLHTPFVVLEAAGFAGVIIASLVFPAFAFAAYGDGFKGESGLRKGVSAGAWVIACSVPAWFLHADDGLTVVAVAVVTCVFYAMLGRVAMPPAAVPGPHATPFPRGFRSAETRAAETSARPTTTQ
ncbi:MAG: hypothetical protein M3154_01215 [Candidatus Eremiobacteraeota bacterium]|nr:hypothetical protein [Candidatus Eremiobacteraeota bacterium]